MNPTDLKLEDLINKDENYTFLVGAGSSVDSPSNQPAGRRMIEAIIKHICAESEISSVLGLIEELRFEQLIEIMRNHIDPDLRIIDYYGECETPNLQHFYLAEMINNGHFVMTTNFDFLIEYALIQSSISKKNIIPVITKKDFRKFNNPVKLAKKGKKSLYKIHGSTKNIITGEDTRNYLVTTMQAFGSNKKGSSVFQIQSFQKKSINRLTEGRNLVVMGYSGSDDFDVVPTLQDIYFNKLIWLNYDKDQKEEKIYSIGPKFGYKFEPESDKTNQILNEIAEEAPIPYYRKDEAFYRVDGNISFLLKKLIDKDYPISSFKFTKTPEDWLNDNFKINPLQKQLITYSIYFELNRFVEAKNCLNEIIKIADEDTFSELKAKALLYLSNIENDKNEALNYIEKALKIAEKIKNQILIANCYKGLGEIYYKKQMYEDSLREYNKAYLIFDKKNEMISKIEILLNLGLIYRDQGLHDNALENYQKANTIAKEQGDLTNIMRSLSLLGEIFQILGNYKEAIFNFEEAIMIADKLGDQTYKCEFLVQMGRIYIYYGNLYSKARECFTEAIDIAEKLKNLQFQVLSNFYTGIINVYTKRYSEAKQIFYKIEEFKERSENIAIKRIYYYYLGFLYFFEQDFQSSKEFLEESLKLSKEMKSDWEIVSDLNFLGMISNNLSEYDEALGYFDESLKISEQLGLKLDQINILCNKGILYRNMNNLSTSINFLEEALSLANEKVNFSGKEIDPLLITFIRKFIKEKLKKKDEKHLLSFMTIPLIKMVLD